MELGKSWGSVFMRDERGRRRRGWWGERREDGEKESARDKKEGVGSGMRVGGEREEGGS